MDVQFWVDHNSNMKLVEEIAIAAPLKSSYFAGHESPRFWITNVAKEGIECMIVAWADSPSDAWMLRTEIREELVRAFQRHDISTHTHRHEWVSQNAISEGAVPITQRRPNLS